MREESLILLLSTPKLTIHQCEQIAKDLGFDKLKFDLVGPLGRKPAQWLDAYMGLFRLEEDPDHFIQVSQVSSALDLWCENVRLPEEEEEK